MKDAKVFYMKEKFMKKKLLFVLFVKSLLL